MSTIGSISAVGRRYGNNIMPGDQPQIQVPRTIGDILNPQAGQTIGDMFGQPSIQRPEFAMPEAPQAPGKREVWRDVLGSVFDAMATLGGGQGNYWNGVQQQQDQYREDQKDYQGLQQQVNMAKYKGDLSLYESAMEAAQGPKPTAMMQNFDYWSGLDENGRANFQRYQDAVKPTIIQNWDGTRSIVGGGGSAPDQLPPDFFNEGGPTPSASGGF
jgi:hypothetical protein